MLKILQARLQQYVNCQLSNIQAGIRNGRETRAQIANSLWIIEKKKKKRKEKNTREFKKKKIYFCHIGYSKTFDCVDHSKLWKILKEMEIPGHLICPLRKLYADQ